MKRSEINKILKDAVSFAKENNFLLPPFALPGRFPDIEEDEEPLYLMSMDYPDFFTK